MGGPPATGSSPIWRRELCSRLQIGLEPEQREALPPINARPGPVEFVKFVASRLPGSAGIRILESGIWNL